MITSLALKRTLASTNHPASSTPSSPYRPPSRFSISSTRCVSKAEQPICILSQHLTKRSLSSQTTQTPKYRQLRANLYIPTVRQVPSDAHIRSHQLMVQAGLIHKVCCLPQIPKGHSPYKLFLVTPSRHLLESTLSCLWHYVP